MGNKETEQAAITHVMALERAAGRDPKDVRTWGLPHDIESSPRMIEIKAFSRSARSEPLPLEDRQVGATRANPEHVRILHGEMLLAMIKRSKPHITYWPAFKAAEYDQAERLR